MVRKKGAIAALMSDYGLSERSSSEVPFKVWKEQTTEGLINLANSYGVVSTDITKWLFSVILGEIKVAEVVQLCSYYNQEK